MLSQYYDTLLTGNSAFFVHSVITRLRKRKNVNDQCAFRSIQVYLYFYVCQLMYFL